jgi:hypothetical protein
MDAFRTLTGGVRFDKKRFNQDLQPFEVSSPSSVAAHFLKSERADLLISHLAVQEAPSRVNLGTPSRARLLQRYTCN